MAKCLLNLWRTAGVRNYGQSRTEVLCWWPYWKGLLMWKCEEPERRFRGQSEKAWEKHPSIFSHYPLSGQFIQEHQTLIGFQKWGAKKESLICISRSTSSITFSLHSKENLLSNYYADFVCQQMAIYLKFIQTKCNKIISNLPVSLKASLCHRTCLLLLGAQVKGTGTMPPCEEYWDCRRSERRHTLTESNLSEQEEDEDEAKSKEKLRQKIGFRELTL